MLCVIVREKAVGVVQSMLQLIKHAILSLERILSQCLTGWERNLCETRVRSRAVQPQSVELSKKAKLVSRHRVTHLARSLTADCHLVDWQICGKFAEIDSHAIIWKIAPITWCYTLKLESVLCAVRVQSELNFGNRAMLGNVKRIFDANCLFCRIFCCKKVCIASLVATWTLISFVIRAIGGSYGSNCSCEGESFRAACTDLHTIYNILHDWRNSRWVLAISSIRAWMFLVEFMVSSLPHIFVATSIHVNSEFWSLLHAVAGMSGARPHFVDQLFRMTCWAILSLSFLFVCHVDQDKVCEKLLLPAVNDWFWQRWLFRQELCEVFCGVLFLKFLQGLVLSVRCCIKERHNHARNNSCDLKCDEESKADPRR